MNSNPKIDVSNWQDTPLPIPVRARAVHRLISPSVLGVLGTILLHTLILRTTYFGSRAHEAHPLEIQEPNDAFARANTASERNLVLLAMPTSSDGNQGAPLIASPPTLTKIALDAISFEAPLSLPNLEVLPLDDDPPLASTAASDDATEQARLAGIYRGQMLARINRIWRRPRTPVLESALSGTPSDASFQCEAQIVQDLGGNVQEILLPRCNGSPAWQRSLVMAIQQASPLPAPPNPSLFTRTVTLSFIGLPYFAGASQDDYEIVAPQLAQTRARTQ